MNYRGALRKMQVSLSQDGIVQYQLPLQVNCLLPVNSWLGKALSLSYQGQIYCIHCGRKTQKSFNQGYCFPCFRRLACCDQCIVRPELCHYFLGTCREPEWGKAHCFQPHVVYLANSSGLKVGITRQSELPTRWIDQGASQGLPILQTPSRHLAGVVEVILKRYVSDRTHWQRMLKTESPPLDLAAERARLLALCHKEIQAEAERLRAEISELTSAETVTIRYPVLSYPAKVCALDLDRQPDVGGTLLGIKGQYLIFDRGVINIRKFAGYEVELRG